MSERIPLLFIAGSGRSGSTIVGNMLGSIPGAVSVGEVRHVWRRGVEEGWDCGCGRSFAQCDFWQRVLREAFPDGFDLTRLLESERNLLRLRRSGLTMRSARNDGARLRGHREYTESLQRIYSAIHQVSGSQVVVDSSKNPAYAMILASLPDIDLRVLHLVRDPRAAAYSWRTPKPSPDRPRSSNMDRVGALKATALWVWWNRMSEVIEHDHPDIPYLRLTYEDLMREPADSLIGVVAELAPELAHRELPLRGREVALETSHTVSGNADRMKKGPVVLRADERWRNGLSALERAGVIMVGAPHMRRYGYRIAGHA